jgi:hypothetical protein
MPGRCSTSAPSEIATAAAQKHAMRRKKLSFSLLPIAYIERNAPISDKTCRDVQINKFFRWVSIPCAQNAL